MESIQAIYRTYRTELSLFLATLISSIIAISSLFAWSRIDMEAVVIEQVVEDVDEAEKISVEEETYVYVDVSGAVKKPGLYKLEENARLDAAIDIAGGLSEQADSDYFARSYNLARTLTDEEKIYVPRRDEVEAEIFVESRYIITHSLEKEVSVNLSNDTVSPSSSEGIDINVASSAELEELSGVGPVTAKKIIEGRPYRDVKELVDKDVLSESVYERIRSEISVQ